MAQSATTVTPPNPSPPTNFSTTGATGPNPPNYSKTQYANPFNLTAQQSGANGSTLAVDGRPQAPYGVNPNPPPYFDDGAAGSQVAFAANAAAPVGGSGGAAGGLTGTGGGTDSSYPPVKGSATAPYATGGVVPAGSSVANEGAGTETVVTQTYAAGVMVPGVAATYQPTGQTPAWASGDPGGPVRHFSDLGNFTGVGNVAGTVNTSPNATHASSLSPGAAATITTFSPANTASGGGTFALTVNGTGFTPQSVVYINNTAMVTVFVNSTQLTVAAAIKRPTAGTYPVFVRTAGTVETPPTNYTYT